jgi:hypothetical protein
MSQSEALKLACDMVKRAKKYTYDVEFSPMDATRTQPAFLYRVVEAVIDAGATTVNIPDTVGYTTPQEFGGLIGGIFSHVPNIAKTVISVHCHDDLGMAVANSLAAVKAGARQVECTVNGIGERAGNASMEEIVMAINMLTASIIGTSRCWTPKTSKRPSPGKANTDSTTIRPPINHGMDMAIIVTVGMRAFRSTCRTITWPRDSPLRVAERT